MRSRRRTASESKTMTWHDFFAILGPIIAVVVSVGISFVLRKMADERKKGEEASEARTLSAAFERFTTKMESSIEKIWDRLQEIYDKRGDYPCQMSGRLSALETQAQANSHRIDHVEQELLNVRGGVHNVRTLVSEVLAKKLPEPNP